MKLISIAILIFVFLNTAAPTELWAQTNHLRTMTFNIRYDNPDDTPNWEHRKDRIVSLINFYEPTFLGTQEALFHQLDYLDNQLSHYDYIGKGRKDGKKGGEFSALLYDTTKAKLVGQSDSTIWLSKTPTQPSKDWDAAFPRILTWGQFELKESGETVFVFNTHFDHVGDTARAKSAKLILKTIREVAGQSPVILTGDFNVEQSSKPYKILTSSFLSDAFYASEEKNAGPEFTYSGFKAAEGTNDDGRRIDYIFVNDDITVKQQVIISSFRDGYYPSDHLPVIADLTLDNSN